MISEQDVKKLKQVFVTKEDLKTELSRYATKADVESVLDTTTGKLIGYINANTEILLTKIEEIKEELKNEIRVTDVTQILDNHEERLIRLEQKKKLN